MNRPIFAVVSRGRMTIPAELRRELGITKGTVMEVRIRNGEIVLHKAKTIFDLAGTSKLSTDEAFRLLDKLRSNE